MKTVIRRMTADDIEGVLPVEQTCFSEPWSREAFSATLLLPYAYYYVAVAADESERDDRNEKPVSANKAGGNAAESAGAAKDAAEPSEAARNKSEPSGTNRGIWSAEAASADKPAGHREAWNMHMRGRIIGECGVRDILGEGEITNVAVLPQYRGNGVATRMLQTLLEESAARGTRIFTLEVRAGNTAALALYRSFGFRTEGRRAAFYEDPVEDALIMWRR